MVGHYENFFIASAGASAAIPGLLVVAVSVVNADDANPTTRELRTLNLAFASIAVVGYSVQLGLAVALLTDSHSAARQRALVLVIVVFYGSAPGRTSEVTGITRRA